MKTILITIPNVVPSLAFLRTTFLSHLQKGDMRILLAVPAYRAEYYKREFAERTDIDIVVPPSAYHILEKCFDSLFRQTIPTRTVSTRQEFALRGGLGDSIFVRIVRFIVCRTLWFLGNIRMWRRFLRRIYSLLPSSAYGEFLESCKPDLIFITTLYDPIELGLMRGAKRCSIPVVGMTKSWDNLTSKNFLPMPPDLLLVQNEIVRDEAIRFSDYPSGRIRVCGEPRFDFYADPSIVMPREEFLQKLGLNEKDRYVLFAGEGPLIVPGECDALVRAFDAFSADPACRDAAFVYRPHPSYQSCVGKFGDRAVVVHESHKRLKDTVSGWEFELKDVRELASILYHADVVAVIASTLAIEASILDKPLIGVAFGGARKPYALSTQRHYDTNHFSAVVRTGGIRIAHSPEEFVTAVAEYRAHPSKDKEGRTRIAREQAFRTDGHAAERTAQEIRKILFEGLN